jgi:hypothetical protein
MFDRIFSAALAFCVLAAGTLAVGTAMLEQHEHVVQLPRVEVTGKRVPAPADKLAQAEVPSAVQ